MKKENTIYIDSIPCPIIENHNCIKKTVLYKDQIKIVYRWVDLCYPITDQGKGECFLDFERFYERLSSYCNYRIIDNKTHLIDDDRFNFKELKSIYDIILENKNDSRSNIITSYILRNKNTKLSLIILEGLKEIKSYGKDYILKKIISFLS